MQIVRLRYSLIFISELITPGFRTMLPIANEIGRFPPSMYGMAKPETSVNPLTDVTYVVPNLCFILKGFFEKRLKTNLRYHFGNIEASLIQRSAHSSSSPAIPDSFQFFFAFSISNVISSIDFLAVSLTTYLHGMGMPLCFNSIAVSISTSSK